MYHLNMEVICHKVYTFYPSIIHTIVGDQTGKHKKTVHEVRLKGSTKSPAGQQDSWRCLHVSHIQTRQVSWFHFETS